MTHYFCSTSILYIILLIYLYKHILLTSLQAGTPYYTAPEMIQQEPYSYPADCWSFGVIVHQLLALERPFDGSSTADLVKSILSGEIPPLPAHYSEDIK